MANKSKNALNTGKGFEQLLAKVFNAYASRGIATFEKVEPPVRIIGYGPARKIIPLRNPFLDYTGVWTHQGGRALHIEAKSTAEGRLPLVGENSGGLTDAQIASLTRWAMAGAAVGVLWLNAAEADVRFVPLSVITEDRQRKSITWEEGWRIPQGPGLIIYDFLSLLTPRVESDTVGDE